MFPWKKAIVLFHWHWNNIQISCKIIFLSLKKGIILSSFQTFFFFKTSLCLFWGRDCWSKVLIHNENCSFWKNPVLSRRLLLLLWWLMLWGRFLLRHSWPQSCCSGNCLVLPLSVSYNCSQEQGDDSHKVEVPLRPQQLVHINMWEYFSYLRKKKSTPR